MSEAAFVEALQAQQTFAAHSPAKKWILDRLGSALKAMFVIDITLKNTPLSLSVQRKTEEDAKSLYHQILDAMRSGNPAILELTCEQQVGKTIGVLSNEISAVQLAEKSGTAAASGRPPGFFALAE